MLAAARAGSQQVDTSIPTHGLVERGLLDSRYHPQLHLQHEGASGAKLGCQYRFHSRGPRR